MQTPTSAILLSRPELVTRVRQHFEHDPSIAVFDASETIPPVSIVAPRAQMLLVVGRAFVEVPGGIEFLDRFREINGTAEIRVLAEGANGVPSVLDQVVGHPAHLTLRAESHPLTRGPVRRAARVEMPDGAKAVVNGVTARLVNVSSMGAQVLCPGVLRPGEQVHVRLPGSPRVRAVVVWSTFELPRHGGQPCYRAGLSFA